VGLSVRILASLVVSGALTLCATPASAQTLNKAEELYKRTSYEASLVLLDKQSAEPAVQFLIGRDYFMLGDFKKSTDYLQKAANSQSSNSEYMDWLGRAYGKRAETSSPFTAPGFASKARQAFEASVRLDPKNSDALSDLFDYYLDAPGFLGGGYDKALAVAEKISAIDPPEGYFEKAKLAQKRKEYQTAEEHFHAAISAAPHEVGAMIELAKFLANQGRTRESDAVFQQAQKTDPLAPRVWFERADSLIKQKRNLDEAKILLQKYVKAPVTVDDPPKQEAFRLLKQVGGA
jgi:tetratricopeptide (TPR) repeat protein